jgi:hypothetical protein
MVLVNNLSGISLNIFKMLRGGNIQVSTILGKRLFVRINFVHFFETR